MTYKLGDRVVVFKETVVQTETGSNVNKRGIVTAMNKEGDFIGVTIDESKARIWFELYEIEHDKNYIVTQILEDL